MDYYGYIVSSLNKKLFFVFGNHNLKHYNRFTSTNNSFTYDPGAVNQHSFGSIFVSGKVIREKKSGLIIAGIGGSINYNNGENQYTDTQMYLKLLKLVPRLMWNKLFHGRYLDIFLTHSPPRGYNDREDPCHRGFKSFLWFLEKFTPSACRASKFFQIMRGVRKGEFCAFRQLTKKSLYFRKIKFGTKIANFPKVWRINCSLSGK